MADISFQLMESILLEQTRSPLPVLHSLIAEQLQKLTGAAVSAFSRYDPDEGVLTTMSLAADKVMVNIVLNVLGKSAIGLRSPVSADLLASMKGQRLQVMSSLTEATQGAIPPAASKVLQAMIGIDHLIGLAFLIDGQVYGTAMICHKQGTPEPSHDMLCFYASMTAIAIRSKQDEQKLDHLAHHDELTGLYNRRYFFQLLEKHQQAGPFPLVLMMMDVDNLKQINDRHGHLQGDEALVRFARKVGDLLPESAILARIGGDEFALLIPGMDSDAGARLQKHLHQGLQGEAPSESFPPVRVSVGMATATDGSVPLQSLLHEADLFMYAHKRSQRTAMPLDVPS